MVSQIFDNFLKIAADRYLNRNFVYVYINYVCKLYVNYIHINVFAALARPVKTEMVGNLAI